MLYEKINKAYQKYLADKVYLKFTSQNFLKEEAGRKVLTEMWKAGNKIIMKNQDVEMFHDGDHLVIIYKEDKQILIRKEDTNVSPVTNPFGSSAVDSLLKISEKITCTKAEKISTLNILIKESHAQKYGLKMVSLEFDEEEKKLKKGVYEMYSNGELLRSVYEYLEVSNSFSNKNMEGKALDYIFSSGRILKNEFQGYSVNDLR